MKTAVICVAVLFGVISAREIRQKRQADVVNRDDTEAMIEMITGMFNGTIDFPKLDPNNLPDFSINCDDFDIGGFYADVGLQCQVVLHCDKITGNSGFHVCPNMTVFDQFLFTCSWAPTVDCAGSTQYYSLNENLHQGPCIDIWGNQVPDCNPNQ